MSAIDRLLTDPALARQLGAAARAAVEARHQMARMVSESKSVYERLWASVARDRDSHYVWIAGQFNYRDGAPSMRRCWSGWARCWPIAVRMGRARLTPDLSAWRTGTSRSSICPRRDASPCRQKTVPAGLLSTGRSSNFQELRARLASAGHRFRTRTDTEVILAAYAAYGVDCVTHLDGMFAFAIWDSRAKRLMLTRDSAGKKPLCYWSHEHGVSFDEPKAFPSVIRRSTACQPRCDRRVSCPAVRASSPLCLRRGRKLPPAHYALIDHSGIRLERYWRLQYVPKQRIDEVTPSPLLVTISGVPSRSG